MSLVVLAMALSMDAFAAALSQGVAVRSGPAWRRAIPVSFAIGIVHAVMPLLGWGLGRAFTRVWRDVDHWVAFVLLVLLGVRMVWQGRPATSREHAPDASDEKYPSLPMMALATGIDAGVAGAAFEGLGQSVTMACSAIGVTAFLLSGLGVFLGKAAGDAIGPRAQAAGGIVLILLGVKILIQHLYFGG
jgi:manganese efflux pump family protein